MSVRIVERRDNPRQRRRGVDHCAAIHPRVQILRRSLHVDLEVREPAQRREDGRQARREHRRIGDDDRVALEPLGVRLDERREMVAPDLFFALGQNDDVDRQAATHDEVRLERLDVREQLPFVVDRSAREDLAVAHRRLERRRRPELERLGRLHVVMPVHEHRRLAWPRATPLGQHDGMAGRRHHLGREPGLAH